MATTKWIGSTSTDWDVAGNWSNGIPATGDTVLVDSSAGRDLLLNVDRTGDDYGPGDGAGLNLALFHIHSSATVNVGGAGAPLKCLANKIKNDGQGNFYWQSAKSSAVDVTDLVVITGQGYSSIGSPSSGGTTITRIEIVGAAFVDLDLRAGTPNYLYVVADGQTLLTPLVNVTGTVVVAEVHVVGAEVDWNVSADATRVFLDNGKFTLSGNSVGKVYQSGGLFLLNSNDTDAIVTAQIKRGILDTTQTAGLKYISGLEYVQGLASIISDSDLLTVTTTIIGD